MSEATNRADDYDLSGCVSRDELKRVAGGSRMRGIIIAPSISPQLNAVASGCKKMELQSGLTTTITYGAASLNGRLIAQTTDDDLPKTRANGAETNDN